MIGTLFIFSTGLPPQNETLNLNLKHLKLFTNYKIFSFIAKFVLWDTLYTKLGFQL